MAVNTEAFLNINGQLQSKQVTLVAVSKTKPVEDIQQLYDQGQRDFGENYVQELAGKQLVLPNDIRWHFIGHLQSNKVKYIAPFVHLIHGVDSYKLLLEIDKQARKADRVIHCLLQVHVAQEETKFGFNELELMEIMDAIHKYKLLNELKNVEVAGLMGMASLTDDLDLVRKEFKYLKLLFDHCASLPWLNQFNILSMGMSSDYQVAIEEGSTLVRIGSLLFGARQ
ncbi:YggS family pyridoxal phosphate-dependent enzyme [Niastella caeni]|uniref:Pyridoxal phosphate homeostasis protein n=1 Tax=Niastella caeni TaxID=2569763 RepID=A0A4S8HL38_9BACT|nr:YggS family pyridoxal phosphate-dependent enzyme [Niastella caeni]THU35883.1 YggS family pyridoxal phosphate-dependent enzyme [Niastella caeni]